MAFLGAPGVGKTQILQVWLVVIFVSSVTMCSRQLLLASRSQQFFKHDFSETHVRTTKPFRFRSCLVCDTMIRELIVLDVPPQVSRRFFLFRYRFGCQKEEKKTYRETLTDDSFTAIFLLPRALKFMFFLPRLSISPRRQPPLLFSEKVPN